MAYPYSTLATPVTDSTTATPNTHSGHHNSVHSALNDLLTELGTDPSGTAASVTARLTAIDTKVLPTGGSTSQVLAKTSGTDYAVAWQTPGAADLSPLHSGLLGVKVWSSGSSAYVWSGGTAPDSNSYTNIMFVDPTGTHNPTSSTGGRSVANDLWETGTTPAGIPTGGTSGQVLAKASSTDYDVSWVTPVSATLSTSTQTASYTLVLGDAGTCVEMNVASANTLTVPPNSSVAFPTGTIVEIHQYGAGQTTLTPGSGVTIRSDGAKLKTTAQYASVSLRKRATDEWVAAGDLAT